jgi:hypothetical protein
MTSTPTLTAAANIKQGDKLADGSIVTDRCDSIREPGNVMIATTLDGRTSAASFHPLHTFTLTPRK